MDPQAGRKKSALNQEFDLLQGVQEDRMAYRSNVVCHERCVKRYFVNGFYGPERTCFERCLDKLNQAMVITNINYGKFEDMQSNKK